MRYLPKSDSERQEMLAADEAGWTLEEMRNHGTDPKQRFLYLLNQNNEQVEVLDRESGKVLTSFGHAGHFSGEFDQAHGIAVDSQGNVYVAENRGRRIQKFKLMRQ